ncbi:MAG TPA: AMP-binding protein [Candidatus Limnocylindrales bacterium]|nr:AMP-binding protein [Candidatus Limnocylindrales bacterium]
MRRSSGEDWPIFGRDAPDVAWRPDPALAAEARLSRFLRSTGEPSLDALQARAVADPAWFWGAATDDIAIPWTRRPREIADFSGGPAWTRWWIGGSFDWSSAAVEPRAAREPNGIAITWEGEDGEIRELRNKELAAEVRAAAAQLASLGIVAGERVGILLPMLPETVVAVLAVTRLGAIFTPIFSGYGAPAIASRLADCGARLLITADGFLRRGAWVDLKSVADAAVESAQSVEQVVVVRRAGDALDVPWTPQRDVWWDATGNAPSGAATDRDPEAPFMIIYTSGTTGRPKGAVHVHGGFPIKAAQDLAHTFDLTERDSLFWFTDLGWMMGPWAIAGSLLLGARLVLYEGAPDFPGPDRLWSLVERHKVTHLGLSPTIIRSLMAHGEEPVRSHDLSSLRVLGSTGEPWNPEPWWWFFREVGGGRCPIINYSGGTEVSGGIVGGNVVGPIKPASFSGPCIGTAGDVVDDDGRPVRGRVGELVIRAPMPGMTRGFWGDRERYEETYWSRWPGLWAHGDWASIDADGYWFIHGRSDDTLNVAGKRVGPAEVESAAVRHPSVLEAAAIGVPHDIKGEAIVVLCVLRPGERDDDGLRADVARIVADDLGKPLKPEVVAVVPSLPKTRSGKVMRRVIRAAWLGLDPGDVSALDDPASLSEISARSPLATG